MSHPLHAQADSRRPSAEPEVPSLETPQGLPQTLFAVCPHDCPDTCAMQVTVADGRAIRIQGDPSHPMTRGTLCTKVNRYLERTYHPDRLTTPLRRVGPKGEGRFEPISWDAALAQVASTFKCIIQEHGPESILPYSYAGAMGFLSYGSLDRRFFHALGASLLDRTICATAGVQGYKYTVGASIGFDPEDLDRARLILLWGTNTLTSNPHLWRHVLEARKAGARVIAIDPWRHRTAQQCDEHLFLKPGTDAALALGLMHVLFRDGLEDRDYLEQYTLGHEALRERALSEYPPARVAAITGVSEADIIRLAHLYATARPAAIRINYGMQRHGGGGMAVRTLACLPAVVGAWREAGGGILLSTSGAFPMNNEALERPDLIPPGTRRINMTRLGEALTSLTPPVRALFVYNSNPAAIAPDLLKVHEGLRRDDLFTVVHDQFLTDTARFADLVLPATTQLERPDLHKPYGHYYLLWSHPVIRPVGESLTNTELFRRLARAMDLTDPCFFDSDEALARQTLSLPHPHLEGITLERLQQEGWVRLNIPRPFAPFRTGGFPTPSGKCELYSERARLDGFDPLPSYTPPHEGDDQALAERYPLQLLTPPAHAFLNSTFANVLTRFEGTPKVELCQTDASARGLQEGDVVEVFNERGCFRATLQVTERVRPGVAVSPSTWWCSLSPDGRNANFTTSQALTDMGGGATFHDNRVEVRKIPG